MTAAAAAERRRLNLVLPDKSARRLHALLEKTEATSYTEVLRNAMRLYEAILEEAEKGNEILVKEPDGQTRAYRLFL